MNKFLLTVLIAVGLAAPAQEAAAQFAEGELTTVRVGNDDLYFTLDDAQKVATLQHYLVKSGRKTEEKFYEFESFTVPTEVTYNGVKYTVALGDNVLKNSPNLKTLVVPDPIATLPDWFAYGCKALSSVTLPSKLKSIGNGAFQQCAALESITLPDGLESLGNDYFVGSGRGDMYSHNWTFNFSGLRSIIIPGSVRCIPNLCFENCRNLESVTIKEGVKTIGVGAFRYAAYENNPLTISIPESVDSIYSAAFVRCNAKSIDIPQSVVFLGSSFCYEAPITGFTIPTQVSVLPSLGLGATQIKELTIPANIKEVYPSALIYIFPLETLTISDSDEPLLFSYNPERSQLHSTDRKGRWLSRCDNLTSLYLGRNVGVTDTEGMPEAQACGTRADVDLSETEPFGVMNALKDITIGEKVTDATALMLDQYPALETITIKSPVPPTINMPSAQQMSTVKVYVPEGSVETYKANAQWNGFVSIEGKDLAGVTEIATDSEAPVIYYNLQGQPVDNPRGGIFIRKQGAKARTVRL